MAKFIPMSWFNSNKLTGNVIAKGKGYREVAGQVIGIVYGTKEKIIKGIDEADRVSILVVGDFEATRFSDGEVVAAQSFYPPKYFAEQIEAHLERNGGRPVQFAVDVVLTNTGKPGIAIAWEVENIMERRADDPLNVLKSNITKGKLRLPAPETQQVIEHQPEAANTAEEPAPDDADIEETVAKGRKASK